jgi:hypothetical protein
MGDSKAKITLRGDGFPGGGGFFLGGIHLSTLSHFFLKRHDTFSTAFDETFKRA